MSSAAARGLTVAPAAARWLTVALAATGLLLLLHLYFIRFRPLTDALAVAICAVALAALAMGGRPGRMDRAGLAVLGIACAHVMSAGVLAEAVGLGEAFAAARSFALVACFLLVARLALAAFGEEAVLRAVALAGAASAAAAAALHLSVADPWLVRMMPLGRPVNPIPGAGGAAAAALAGLALLATRRQAIPWRVVLAAGVAAALFALVLTHSRGPLLGVLVGIAIVLWRRQPAWLMWALVPAAFLAASALVPIEHFGRAAVCEEDDFLLCRPALRFPLWIQSLELIAAHPWAGLGERHQLNAGWLNNPHHVLLSLALYYGLPFALACLVAAGLLLRRAARLPDGPGTRWARAMLGFSAVYYAVESNPFGFLNVHFLFLWLPVAIVLATEPRRA